MELAIPLSEISEQGVEKIFDAQELWLDPIKEFNISCMIKESLEATVFMLKHEEGCLVRGQIKGKVALLCDRCGDEALYPLDINFEEFEQVPKDYYVGDNEDEIDELEKSLIFSDSKGILHLNLGSLLWEELALFLPIKPLCSENCAGICMKCGVNKNHGECSCDTTVLDMRFAKLQGLKINKK